MQTRILNFSRNFGSENCEFSDSFCALIFMMNHVVYLYLLYLMKFLMVVLSGESDSCIVKKVGEANGRQERALLFPPSSTIGVSAVNLTFFQKKINFDENIFRF